MSGGRVNDQADDAMGPPGRLKGEYRSAQHAGNPVSGPTLSRRQLVSALAGSGLLAACGGGAEDEIADDAELSASDEASGKPGAPEAKTVILNASRDLLGWTLELPINAQGLLSGDAASVVLPSSTGVPGWGNYFSLSVQPKRLTFAAPVKGAETNNAGGPRCEMKQTDSAQYRWDAKTQKRSLTLDLHLMSTPSGSEPKVVLAQIHNGTHNLVMLKYIGPKNGTGAAGERGTLKAVFNWSPSGITKTLDSSYELGTKISVVLTCDKGVGRVTCSTARVASKSVSNKLTVGSDSGQSFFKFGAYPQRDGADLNSSQVAKVVVSSASMDP